MKKNKKVPRETKSKKIDDEQPPFKTGTHEYMFEVAYVIKDKNHGNFSVRKSANAWWINQEKLEKVIEGKRLRLNDKECCYYSGISEDQLKYFLEQHPHFSGFFDVLPMHPRVAAKITIIKSLNDPNMARWYAEHNMKDEFAKGMEVTGRNGHAIEVNVQKKMSREDLMREAAARGLPTQIFK